MQVQPYLFFDGRAEEAIEFYKKALGAKVDMLMRWKDSARQVDVHARQREQGDALLHDHRRTGVMISDGRNTGNPKFEGFALSIDAKTEAEADKLFGALGDGGKVTMPLGKTFFSPRFGMLADKFGVNWMILVAQ